MLDEFKDLPFYELDWETEEPSRVYIPKLSVHSCSKSVLPAAHDVIEEYLNGNFKSTVINIDGENKEVVSQEAVLYVNSVKNICEIISRNGLTLENTNVLCSKTTANDDKVRKAFGLKKSDLKAKGIDTVLGSVPIKGEKHKMFTLCTRTVYLGADFYSTNARTFIFSDANIECLATDISMDLPQIIGRQRLDENPWKGTAEFYYRIRENEEDYEKILQTRLDETKSIMRWYEEEQNNPEHKNKFLSFIKNDSSNVNFESYYLSVSDKGTLEYNKFVYISQKRAYEISQIDYRDRYQVLNAIESSGVDYSLSDKQKSFLGVLNSFSKLDEKLRYFVYNTDLTEDEKRRLFGMGVPYPIERVYELLGPDRIKALGCIYTNCKAELDSRSAFSELDFENEIYKEFKEGETYTNADLKDKLQKIFESCNGQIGVMKASDMSKYFELKQSKHTIDGKRVVCQTLLKKKKV
jgi:hypothetical protein